MYIFNIVSHWCTISKIQNSHNFEIISYETYQRTTGFCFTFESDNINESILQFSFGHNLGQEPSYCLLQIIFFLFFFVETLTANIFFHPRYLNPKIKVKNQGKLILFRFWEIIFSLGIAVF